MPHRIAALLLCLLPAAVASAASSNFRTASTLQIAYEGAMLSFGLADFVGDGSKTLLAGGFPWPLLDQTLPIKAIKISRAGALSDISATLIDGSPGQSWGRRGVVADFNGDGRPDFFSASHGYDAAPFPGDYQTLLLSQANGKLKDESASLLPHAKQFVHSAAAADLKRNGRPELFVGILNSRKIDSLDPSYTPPSSPQPGWLGAYLLRNDGSGHFTFDNKTLADKVTFSYNTGVNPWVGWDSPGSVVSSAFADLNGDGYPDLILGGDGDQNYAGSVYFNDGKGGFRTTEYKLPAGLFGAKNTITVDVLPFDVDGDGKVDLVLSQTANSPFYAGSKLQILINKGNGTSAKKTTFTVFENVNASLPAPTDSDRVFNYLESLYPQFVSPLEVNRGTASGYYYRHYPNNSAYLATAKDPGTAETMLYYLGPASGNATSTLGTLASWLTKAVGAGY